MKTEFLNVGDSIKTFEVKSIVDSFSFKRDSKGRKTKYETKFYLLLSSEGQERVLEVGKTNLNDCVKYMPTFSHNFKFISWNQI